MGQNLWRDQNFRKEWFETSSFFFLLNLIKPNHRPILLIHGVFKSLVTYEIYKFTAISWRSFSTLRRIKSYLRNTIALNRRTDLTSLNIHTRFKLVKYEILQEMFKKYRKFMNAGTFRLNLKWIVVINFRYFLLKQYTQT